jgi:hypothetical protein
LPTATDEIKLSKAIQAGLNNMGLNYAVIVNHFMSRNTEYQLRMMDLIMAFLSRWAIDYRFGHTTEGEPMHRLGEVASAMLDTLDKHGLHHRG